MSESETHIVVIVVKNSRNLGFNTTHGITKPFRELVLDVRGRLDEKGMICIPRDGGRQDPRA
jgi:hypothetical protein